MEWGMASRALMIIRTFTVNCHISCKIHLHMEWGMALRTFMNIHTFTVICRICKIYMHVEWGMVFGAFIILHAFTIRVRAQELCEIEVDILGSHPLQLQAENCGTGSVHNFTCFFKAPQWSEYSQPMWQQSGTHLFTSPRAPLTLTLTLALKQSYERELVLGQQFPSTEGTVSEKKTCLTQPCTLGMRLQIKWHCKLVHGCMVYAERAPKWRQFRMAPAV